MQLQYSQPIHKSIMAINCQITGSGVVVQIADTLACVAVDSFPRERGRRAKALRRKERNKKLQRQLMKFYIRACRKEQCVAINHVFVHSALHV